MSQRDKRNLTAAIAIVGLATITVVCIRLGGNKGAEPTPASRAALPSAERQNGHQSSASTPSGFEVTIQGIRTASDATSTRSQLLQLRGELQSLPSDTASAKIRSVLDSKADAATRLPFKVGADGFMTESPSLRVFLLDYLAQIDPAAAADYAKVVLASMDSPDEWAVALRNLARGDTSPEGRALLQQKTGDMLRYEAWQQNPSTGYLEAFDAAVYLGGTGLIAPLADLVRKQDNQAVAHAAYLALDRLVINDATGLLSALQADSSLMEGREQTRANYFARADVGDAPQREIVEHYLLDPERQASELQGFAGVFPNANYMISQNLLTSNVTPGGAALAQRDRDALRVVGEWLTDQRFAPVRPHLLKIQQRLQEFSRQAESNR